MFSETPPGGEIWWEKTGEIEKVAVLQVSEARRQAENLEGAEPAANHGGRSGKDDGPEVLEPETEH